MIDSNRTSCLRNGPPPGLRVDRALAMLLAMTSMRIRSADRPEALILPATNILSNAMRNTLSARCSASRDRAVVLGEFVRDDLRVDLEIDGVLLQAGHFVIDVDIVAVGPVHSTAALDHLGLNLRRMRRRIGRQAFFQSFLEGNLEVAIAW